MSEPNNCVIHVILKDNDAQWQQQLLGTIGVNLIHACFQYIEPEEIILSLSDNVSNDRFEIDMFSISGHDFQHVDNRLMSLLLVKNGLSHAAMFGSKGNVLQASEALHKKNVLVLRGRFRPVTTVSVDMMFTGIRAFKNEIGVDKNNLLALTELTLNDLTLEGEVDETDFLDRVDLLCSLGQTVLITNYQEHYKLASYLSNITRQRKLGIICGLGNLVRIFDESYYENLKGGILESFGRLFGSNVKLYIYPTLVKDKIRTINDFEPEEHLKELYAYLISNNKIADLVGANTKLLSIISDNVLDMIKSGSSEWERMVPLRVRDIIKKENMFNLPIEVQMDEEDDLVV
jgi:hypothetical protein